MLHNFKNISLSLLIYPFILSIFGLATVFSIGDNNVLFYKQLILQTIGLFLALGIIFFDWRFLRNGHYTFIFFSFATFLLLLLVILGATINGSQSWFRIGGVSLQPVELAKLALIFILAKYFYKRHVEVAYLPTIIYSSFYALLIFILTIFQPDLGSGLVVLAIWGVIVFVSGIPKKYILAILSFACVASFFSWNFFLQDYQKERIFSFVDPTRDIRGSGYNVYQSMIAIGSGGLWGKGINLGSQSKLSYLPEYETDFIFAAFAEEWGYVGVIFCILTYLILILTILNLSKTMETNFETLFCVGVAAYFIVHTGVNIGMNIGLLPVTGIPLPFMSAGGTHILVEWIMLGFIISSSKYKARNFSHSANEVFI